MRLVRYTTKLSRGIEFCSALCMSVLVLRPTPSPYGQMSSSSDRLTARTETNARGTDSATRRAAF